MSGFATIIGFIFSFFVIIGVFTAVAGYYKLQVDEQYEIISDPNRMDEIKGEFSINNPYFSMGRVQVQINSSSPQGFSLTRQDKFCLDAFITPSTFIAEGSIHLDIEDKASSAPYEYFSRTERASLSIKSSKNGSQNFTLSLTNCAGKQNNLHHDNKRKNWRDDFWTKRQIINAQNENPSQENYIHTLILNESNFNFSKYPFQENIFFSYDLNEASTLALSFDNYEQNIKDHSPTNAFTTLGALSNPDPADPSPETKENSAILNSLGFNGSSYLRVSSNSDKIPQEQLTLSLWVFWDSQGASEQYIFSSSQNLFSLGIINDGGADDNKIFFTINTTTNSRTLISDTQLEANKWNHITAIFNDSQMYIYKNTIEDGSRPAPGSLSLSNTASYIGSQNQSTGFFNGRIDETRLFTIALNEEEIQKLYSNSLKFRDLQHSVNYWNISNNTASIDITLPVARQDEIEPIHFYYAPKTSLN